MTKSRKLMLSLLLATLLAGCGSDEVVKPQQPAPFPANDTPENTILRFLAAYERMDSTVFAQLLTGDYRFEFSETADPDLAQEYVAGWFKTDERISARNMFFGGVNDHGQYRPGAQTIELEFEETAPLGDPLDGRNPAVFKVLETAVRLIIQLPPDENDPEGITFVVGGADPVLHRFFLVRGDAANGLGEDQPADSTRWYIWMWEDRSSYGCGKGGSPPVAAEAVRPGNACAKTWGAIKVLYR